MKEEDWRSFSPIAQQILAPSNTDVPRPSSSIMISEVGPRFDRMKEVFSEALKELRRRLDILVTDWRTILRTSLF